MPQQCAEPPPRPPPTGAKQGHNPPTTPPPQPDSPGKPPKPHPPNPTHPRGSSPHTRGAPFDMPVDLGVCGIIPAYAGSTRSADSSIKAPRDHPRIRGEHNPRSCSTVAVSGSSPHTRGAPGLRPGPGFPVGIIPAYAGSTQSATQYILSVMDHPRIRGEHSRPPEGPGRGFGSSPHTRGALGRTIPAPASGRIIPAYAGSTLPSLSSLLMISDHPRIRGEHNSR